MAAIVRTGVRSKAGFRRSVEYSVRIKDGPETALATPPGPDRPHLSERGSAVSIMLPPDSEKNTGWRAGDMTPASIAPVLERFSWYFEVGAPDACWIWGGARGSNRYGLLPVSTEGRRTNFLPHRVAWVAATGRSLTNDLTIDHLCANKLCVNPAHLEPVSLAENTARYRARRSSEREYPELSEGEIQAARERARQRAAQHRQAKMERNRAAARARRWERIPCPLCGRLRARETLKAHQDRKCPAGPGRKKKAA